MDAAAKKKLKQVINQFFIAQSARDAELERRERELNALHLKLMRDQLAFADDLDAAIRAAGFQVN
jgi:hypothetical protein